MKKSLKYDVLICGGGFRGIISAALFAKKGKKACLIDAGKNLGGVLNSIPWEGYKLDIGCHLFDNVSKELTEFFFDIHSDFEPLTVNYQSIMSDYSSSDVMAQPDFTFEEFDHHKILQSLDEVKKYKNTEGGNYYQYLENRFGKYIASIMEPCVIKKCGVYPTELEYSASSIIAFNRLRLFSDTDTRELKKENFYDERLALPSVDEPMLHYQEAENFYSHRNFYPKSGAMAAFCESSEKYLRSLGVKVMLGSKITSFCDDGVSVELGKEYLVTADLIVWSGDLSMLQSILYGASSIQNLMCPVAAVLAYFEIDAESVNDLTYVHDFRLNTPAFRISTSGTYSNQIIDGKTFVCAEIFTQKDSELWNINELDCDSVWQQIVDLNIVKSDKYHRCNVIKTPSAYKLPKVGCQKEIDRFISLVEKEYPAIKVSGKLNFSKVDMFDYTKNLINSI